MPSTKKPVKEIPVIDVYPTFETEEERKANEQDVLRKLYNVFTHQDISVTMRERKRQ